MKYLKRVVGIIVLVSMILLIATDSIVAAMILLASSAMTIGIFIGEYKK